MNDNVAEDNRRDGRQRDNMKCGGWKSGVHWYLCDKLNDSESKDMFESPQQEEQTSGERIDASVYMLEEKSEMETKLLVMLHCSVLLGGKRF